MRCWGLHITIRALLGKRMMLAYELNQPVFEHMSVNLGRGDVRMAEKLLHGAQSWLTG